MLAYIYIYTYTSTMDPSWVLGVAIQNCGIPKSWPSHNGNMFSEVGPAEPVLAAVKIAHRGVARRDVPVFRHDPSSRGKSWDIFAEW